MQYTLIEYMPECHRASHRAAGNSGRWPANGAERVYVEGTYADSDLDEDWASVIEDCIPDSDIPEGGTRLGELPEDAMRAVAHAD